LRGINELWVTAQCQGPNDSFQKPHSQQLILVLFLPMLQSKSLLHLSSSPPQQDLTQVALTLLQQNPTHPLTRCIQLSIKSRTTLLFKTQHNKGHRNTLFMQIHNTLYFYTNSLFLICPGPLGKLLV